MAPYDLTIDEIGPELRLGKRTLEAWLAQDLLRSADDRRFQFHARRGRKRIWSPNALRLLREAIERESQPGGVLAGSRSSSGMATGTPMVPFVSTAAQSASAEVLAWPLRPRPSSKRSSRATSSSTRSRRGSPARSGAVIPLR